MRFEDELKIAPINTRCKDYNLCNERCDGSGNIYKGLINISSCLGFRTYDFPYMIKQNIGECAK